ncbi:TonB-dependent receptor (plasmid) [Sphingomonas panacis]|uniref:TonB-dependent receptor n=1 Tax=Sphingomonas panacis TaxID=1560345 RepID=A0A1B3ZIH5_9SPHN|nr:TonB-dependent receptor [Sphingomonas panacis]AOH87232.1 TonB-dependent receptor [Sphingomonas panacis]
MKGASLKGVVLVSALCGPASANAQAVAGSQLGQVPSTRTSATLTPAGPMNENSPTSDASQTGDIIVTAQKRSERLNEVPMSITASTGDQLKSAGITNTDDLAKIVPGFTFQKSAYGLPIYYIRGVGFNDTTLGVSPAVTVYVDQVPLPYSAMTRGALFDIERVEVLKGPQGTLFGQNSTGGAINYIAAKPTNRLQAGFDLGYGRFNSVNTEAFISGPLTDTLKGRIAVENEYQGDWQKSYVNNDTIGQKRFLNGRAILDWDPTSTVRISLSASGWRDRSDTQQGQFIKFTPLFPAGTGRPPTFPIATFPAAPANARAAAWDPGFDFAKNDSLYQFALHGEVDLSDAITLTSITSYAHFKTSTPLDLDASIYPVDRVDTHGTIETFSQELRLSGVVGDNLHWMFGGNYQNDRVKEHWVLGPDLSTGASVGPFTYDGLIVDNDQKVKTGSIFASLDYNITRQLTLQGSIRYTDQRRHGEGCGRDDGTGDVAAALGFLSGLITGTPATIAPGACATLNSQTGLPGLVTGNLNEDNLSWRAGVSYKPSSGTLFYANVTKGYKSGSFPTLPAGFSASLAPIKQESILAYEVGAKTELFDRKVQISAAAFYYDYRDKQLVGYKANPPFGTLPALVSIPKSKVQGAELSILARPVRGLTINIGGTYIDSKVLRNPINPIGPYSTSGSFVGEAFPFTPKWQGTVDTEYRFALSSALDAFVGGNVSARSGTQSVLTTGGAAEAPLEALLYLKGYALLDLRAGVETQDGRIRFELWGRNVTNKYYTNSATRVSDYTYRFTGMPVTYGATLRYRFGQ